MGLSADLAAEFQSLTILTHEVDGRWYLSVADSGETTLYILVDADQEVDITVVGQGGFEP